MKLNWLLNGFITKELYAPFTISTENSDIHNKLGKAIILLQSKRNDMV